MAAPTTTYRIWKRLAGVPGGTRLFSAAATVRVPYFASIAPHVVRMEPGYAEVTVPKWFFVYNHLHTVHAIASCNAAEMAMGMLMEATVPTTHRWIPKAMNVRYLEKATTSLRARARLQPPDFSSITDGADVIVPVSVLDTHGTEVVHADITCWVTAVSVSGHSER
jgi:acyl-coenzyme A thioesterase PaaI-like protein